MKTTSKLLVVAESILLVDALAMVLRHTFPYTEILTATSGGAALAITMRAGNVPVGQVDRGVEHAPRPGGIDVAVIAAQLPDISGTALVQRMQWFAPQAKCLMLSAEEDRKSPGRAAGGARSAEPDAALHELLASIRRTLPSMGEPVATEGTADWGARAPVSHGRAFEYRLTPRQFEVLGLLAKGLRNSSIAAHLKTSEKTVKAHVSAVFQALDVTNRTQATLVAQRCGLVEV